MDFVEFAGGPGGTLFSRAGGTGSAYAATKTLFDFLITGSGGADIAPMEADFKFEATTHDLATVNTQTFTQGGFAGTFSFTYSGATPFKINGITYSGPVNLLSGTFTQASLVGLVNGTAGGVFDSNDLASLIIGDITFSSDIVTFPNNVEKDFSLSLTAANPNFNVSSGDLKSFTAVSTGSFSSDPKPIVNGATPELATWSMMVMGFGLIGGTIRSRRNGAGNPLPSRQPEFA